MGFSVGPVAIVCQGHYLGFLYGKKSVNVLARGCFRQKRGIQYEARSYVTSMNAKEKQTKRPGILSWKRGNFNDVTRQ